MLEQQGIPTVVLGTVEFETLAVLEARNRGLAELPLALVPHPLGGIREDEVVAKADLAVEMVRRAVDPSVIAPGPAAPTFRLDGSYADINRHYQERGWTDGLPIVPPTEDESGSSCAGSTAIPRTSWPCSRRARARPPSSGSRSTR